MVVGAEGTSDLFLLLIVLRTMGQIVGRTRLQKVIYLLRQRYQLPFSFRFKPYFYGPYSEELSDAVENLVALGMIEENRRYLDEGVIEYSYKLTKRGTDFLDTNAAGDVARKPPLGANLSRAIRELALPTYALVATAKSVMSSSTVRAVTA